MKTVSPIKMAPEGVRIQVMADQLAGDGAGGDRTQGWTYLTNHAHVLVYLAGNAGSTLREIAKAVGITERAVHRIVSELAEDGVLTRMRTGRRNEYEIDRSRRLRHPIECHCTVGQVLDLIHGS